MKFELKLSYTHHNFLELASFCLNQPFRFPNISSYTAQNISHVQVKLALTYDLLYNIYKVSRTKARSILGSEMTSRKLNVLIGGGRGFIGSELTKVLRARGHGVTVVSRKSERGMLTWDDIDQQGLPQNCDAVVNLAGENIMNPLRRFNDQFKSDLIKSRIGSNQTLVRAISQSQNPPSVFISSSAVGYYDLDPKARYTEDSPSTGNDFLSQLCRDWESSATLPTTVSTRHVTVRIGLALGRNGGVIYNMILPFWCGVGGPVGSGKQWFPWIHVQDVAGIFAFALENGEVSGRLNAVAPGIVTNGEFAKEFGRALWRPAFFPLPGFVVRLAFGEERAKIMLEGQHVSPQRTQELGYEFIYPQLTEACQEFGHILHNEIKM